MATYWSPITIIVASFILINLGGAQKYKVCTTFRNLNACEQLNRTEDVKCFLRENAVDCLLMVESGEAAIVSVSAEEALLASALTSNLVVLAEFIDQNSREPAEFETAVVVRKGIFDEIKSLKGAKYCHTDIDQTNISPFIEKEFEMDVISQNNIEVCTDEIDEKSITEYYIKALSDFFGASCRQGQWTIANSTLDQELKQRYSNLLDLCPVVAYAASTQLYSSSLECLMGGGDVAFTSISAINNYLIDAPEIPSNYSLLCKNGSIANITDKCPWTRQPWPLLVGNIESVTYLPQELTNWFSPNLYIPKQTFAENADTLVLADKYVKNLKEIISPGSSHLINVTYDTPNLSTYIAGFRTMPRLENSKLCQTSIGFCVASTEETQKCRWLQQAALNYGIQPTIACIVMTSKTQCLQSVESSIADIVVVDPNMMYTINRLNLSIIAFGEGSNEHMIKTVLVVKTATIQRLSDLEGKNGFFAKYGDIAWVSFANALSQDVWTDTTSYAKDLSSFLGESCMPGVREADHDRSEVLADKMCSLCSSDPTISTSSANCNADSSNRCYGDDGALECLGYTGDFAVITIRDNTSLLPNGTNIMCKNGSLSMTNTFQIDDDCALSLTMSDYIVVRKQNPKSKNIVMLLEELDKRLAEQIHTPFRIYGPFGGVKDLIFKDTTFGMEFSRGVRSKLIEGQLKMFENIPSKKEERRNSAPISTTSFVILFTLILFVI